LKALYGDLGIDIRTLLDAQASEKQLNDLERTGALAQFSCLHMSTHGHNVNSDTPMESSMVLYDSLLDGMEIANWRLNAEVTVLSACCSGQRPYRGRRMAELPGDDLFGLQAAFFAAGAKRVLGSLWPVDAGTAHRLVMAFHRHYASGRSPERALQKAIVDHIAHARPRLRKSYYWAAFFLSAVGRPADGAPSGGEYD
jgi:CHAT domain-containing protein